MRLASALLLSRCTVCSRNRIVIPHRCHFNIRSSDLFSGRMSSNWDTGYGGYLLVNIKWFRWYFIICCCRNSLVTCFILRSLSFRFIVALCPIYFHQSFLRVFKSYSHSTLFTFIRWWRCNWEKNSKQSQFDAKRRQMVIGRWWWSVNGVWRAVI